MNEQQQNEQVTTEPPVMGDDSQEPTHSEDQQPIETDSEAVVEQTSAPQPRLVVKRAGQETEETFFFGFPATIGRFDPTVGPIDVDMADIPEGSYVSRKHAKITETDGVYTITDLGSSNGTYVAKDGEFQKVDEAEIQSGDEIALGNARLVFYV